MNSKKFFLLTICLFGIGIHSFNGQCQEYWNLERCLEYAERHNVQINESKLAILQTRQDVIQSEIAMIPEIRIGADNNYSWGRSVDMQELVVIKNKMNSSMSLSASASIPILDGFSKIFDSKTDALNLEISEHSMKRTEYDIKVQVIKAYLQILLSKEYLKIVQSEFDDLNSQRQNCRQLVSIGRQPQSALLEFESRIADSQTKIIESQWQIELDKLALEQLLGLPYGEIKDISESVIPEDCDSLPVFNSTGLSDNPSIMIAERNYDKTILEYKRAQAGLLPVIGVSLGYMTYASSTSTDRTGKQLSSNINPTLGISLQIPINQYFTNATRLRKLKYETAVAAMERQKVEREKENELQNYILQAKKHFYTKQTQELHIENAQKSYEAVSSRFSNGVATALDLISAQNILTAALSEYYRSAIQYIFNLKLIDCILGHDITL